MVSARACGLAAALVVMAAAVGGCSTGSAANAAGSGSPASAPSASFTGPAAGSSAASGLPTDPGQADPATTPAASSSVPAGVAVATGDLDAVVSAAGVLQYLHCAGSGSPTVVVATGLGVSHAAWDGPVMELAQHTRTCVYDRPGLGSSPARTSPLQVVDAGLNARELALLLTTAHQQEPYVLVGQGYGTLVARAFAGLYPGRVRRLVLAGSAPAHPAAQVFWTEAGHRVDIAASTRAAGRTPTGTAAFGVFVLPTDDPTSIVAQLQRS